MSVISEVKQRADIVETVSQYVTLTKTGRNFRALCPFHSEKHPSFFVYPEQQSWHCFGACNTGGDVFSFVMKKQNLDFGEALRFLAQRAGITIPSRFEPGAQKDAMERLYQANEAATQYFHNLLLNSPVGGKTRNYLASRGILLKTMIDFQLGCSLNSWDALKHELTERGYTESELLEAGLIVEAEDKKTYDRFRHRLLFPIKDARSRTVGFGARVLDESLPKYLNSPQTPIFDKGNSLYGTERAAAAIRQQNLAVIVEGYMDAITAHQSGFTNVVATMGTSITEKQLSMLKRLTKNIALALDADAAGDEANLRCAISESSLETEVKVVVLPRGKDPDDIIKEDAQTWQQLLDSAIPVIDYTFNTVAAKLDLTQARDKSSATERLLPIIAQIKDGVRQDHYLSQLSRLTGISYRRLESTLKGYMTKQKSGKSVLESARLSLSPLRSNPLEEYCLTLLLQHPELKNKSHHLLAEYFEESENREIFVTWQQTEDPSALKEKLDSAIGEHLDSLINKKIPANLIEEKYADCVLNLKKKYLQNLEAKKAEILALAAETGGTTAELAKLKEQGIETSQQLAEVFTQKARRSQEVKR